jgi:hypothetical protein
VLSTQLQKPKVLHLRMGKREQETKNDILDIHNRLLGLPDSLDTLGKTNIIRLKLVEPNTSKNGSGVQSPHGKLAGLGDALGGEVVDDA